MNTILNLGNSILNTWLIPLSEGWCLVDGGLKQGEKKFWKRLAKKGIAPQEIKYVVLTHHHADHAGFLASVLKKTGAKFICSEKNTERLRAGMNDCHTYVSTTPMLLASSVTTLFLDTYQCYPPVDVPYINPLTQPLQEEGFTFFELSGHTECDLCFIVDKKLFCGDILMSGNGSYHHAPAWIKNKYDLLRSWNSLNEMEIDTIYAGHGKPFSASLLPNAIQYWQDKGVFRLHK